MRFQPCQPQREWARALDPVGLLACFPGRRLAPGSPAPFQVLPLTMPLHGIPFLFTMVPADMAAASTGSTSNSLISEVPFRL